MFVKIAVAVSLFMFLCTGVFAESTSKGGNSPKKENPVIEIHHCSSCGFRSRAEKVAQEIKDELGFEAKLIVGSTGSFDVFLNGELIFSKGETGRFPEPGEIVRLIKEKLEK